MNIIDPLHEPDPNALPDESTSWTSPTRHPMFEYLVPPLSREQHPLFHHDRPVFLFDSKTKLHAGIIHLAKNQKLTFSGFVYVF